MSYSYNMAMELAGGLVSVNGVLGVALNIVLYVFTSLGLYTMAKRRGLRKPWLAWIPVVNVWIVGSLSDQYRYVVKGEEKSKRKSLLILNIVSAVLSVVVFVLFLAVVFIIVAGLASNVSDREIFQILTGPGFGLLGLAVLLVGVKIAYLILYYMALYDVYTACDPKNTVMYLVLSILFGITKPFFLFFNRDKDEGMPPRRTQEEPVFHSTPVEEEPWQRPDIE